MSDIQISPNVDPNPVSLKFTFQTPQAFYYIVEIIDDNGKQYFHDLGQWNGKTVLNLGPASALVGLYLTIYWTVIDPMGAGNNFNSLATAIHNGQSLINAQNCSGSTSTTQSSVVTVGKFV
jgi:hypothetical protein